MTRYFGAHLSISGGYHKAVERVSNIGGNCLQIFSTSPRSWTQMTVTPELKNAFRETKKNFQVDPVFFHASYLINLADEGEVGSKSKQSLIYELGLASQLNIQGSIVHTGSFKGDESIIWDVSQSKKYSVLINNFNEVLAHTPSDTFLIIENAGNMKIGQTIDEIAAIIRDINNERIKVCLDTCHLHSAGYDLTTPDKYRSFFEEFEVKIGLQKLIAIHTNDSRDPFGSRRDRHENLGQGTLTLEPFRHLVNDVKLQHIPFIIETPGFDGSGPDKKNLDIIKSLIAV